MKVLKSFTKVLTILEIYGIMYIESEVKKMSKVLEIGFNEFGAREDFYRITMKTKEGKILYLTENYWYGKNYEKIACKWTFCKMDALWFETYEQAENFAKVYFKNFTDYTIEQFEEIM